MQLEPMRITMKPHRPESLPLPDESLDWRSISRTSGQAGRAIARYDGALLTIANPTLLLSPLMANEAVLSSRIEGTQATLDEVYQQEAGADTPIERRDDIEEVINYRAAVRFADRASEERGLSLSLLRETHQRLMQGVRGADKNPGAFRKDQNWIGRSGCSIEEARFVPPDPVTMHDALLNWESYVKSDIDDPVIATAIAHAQFEIIHPFNDGNGRIGRMTIPLMLARHRAISAPFFYISQFLEQNRDTYYDHLLGITENGDWKSWIIFFCEAVIYQAEENLRRAHSLHELQQNMRQKFTEATHSQYASAALDIFFERPVITGPAFAEAGNFNTKQTAAKILKQLEEAHLISCIERGSGRRPSKYAMHSIIRTAEGL